ncbi:hypothetical protein NEOC84_001364|uniref:hypothetical protein n=1 Tax=Neochlamydia sp. AcF84 TaxID=2315858 RepID=UPI00140E7504|nr:hypothetical protein [Neochlamydia sp. AcF84]NGY95447.1 hypothetical protein [Neochlamydia sp. AcF84]
MPNCVRSNLKAYNNRLTALSAEIGQLSQDLALQLAGNPLESIPEEIKQRFRL